MKQRTIRISQEEWKDIKMLSVEYNMTLTEVIRVLLDKMKEDK